MRAHDGGRNGGKSAPPKQYKEGSSSLLIHHWSISISLWLLKLLSQVTGCLAQVLQAKSSPFPRGTSSATLGGFSSFLQEDHNVSSSCIISFQVVCIIGGCNGEEAEFIGGA